MMRKTDRQTDGQTDRQRKVPGLTVSANVGDRQGDRPTDGQQTLNGAMSNSEMERRL